MDRRLEQKERGMHVVPGSSEVPNGPDNKEQTGRWMSMKG